VTDQGLVSAHWTSILHLESLLGTLMIRIQKPPKKYTNSLEGEISKVSGSFILMSPSRKK